MSPQPFDQQFNQPFNRGYGQPPRGPELRIGDDEREAAVTALGEHYAAGRLTKEEYDERAERAWAAKTGSALMPLFADLPRPQAAGRPTGAQAAGGPSPDRGHPGWWLGARMAPILLVVLALVVLTHLPLFLLALVGVFVWVRMTRPRGHSRGYADRHWGQQPPRGPWLR